ncbi:MAG: hypothetical protein JW818_17550 [Pirellulales bacterium]|nr:hypothetical protein [Pirellulales bacterium]
MNRTVGLVLVLTLLSSVSAETESPKLVVHHDLIKAAPLPKGYKSFKKPITLNGEVRGYVLAIARDQPGAAVAVQTQNGDLPTRRHRMMILKAAVNGMYQSMRGKGFTLLTKNIPDIEKYDYSKPIVVELQYQGPDGTAWDIVLRQLYVDKITYNINVMANNKADLKMLLEWANTVTPLEKKPEPKKETKPIKKEGPKKKPHYILPP